MSESKVLVEIDYADVMKEPSMVKDTLGKTLASAFQNGEMVAMRNVPGYVESSRKVLPMAYKLAKLPEETKASLTSEESHWQAGWNQGKVMLNKKVMDPKKASFYFNPLTDSPATPEEREMYPTVFPVNVWPSEDDMPGFQGEAKLLGRIMHNALVQFAKHVDAYVFEQCGVELATGRSNVYSKEVIHKAVRKTEKGKCRLLYYSPFSDEEAEAIKKEEEKNGQDNDGLMWNGWHLDSGFLTALAGDIYVDDETGEEVQENLDDENTGLFIATHANDGAPKKVKIPSDCMGIQFGEILQIATGGHVVATPHCIRGSTGNKARIGFACFVDAGPDFPLSPPNGYTKQDVLKKSVANDFVVPLQQAFLDDEEPQDNVFVNYHGKTYTAHEAGDGKIGSFGEQHFSGNNTGEYHTKQYRSIEKEGAGKNTGDYHTKQYWYNDEGAGKNTGDYHTKQYRSIENDGAGKNTGDYHTKQYRSIEKEGAGKNTGDYHTKQYWYNDEGAGKNTGDYHTKQYRTAGKNTGDYHTKQYWYNDEGAGKNTGDYYAKKY